jgi:hypothetical protein
MSAPPYEAVPQNAYNAAPPAYAQPPVQVYQTYQQSPTTPLIVTSQPHHWGEMYVEFVKIALEIPWFLVDLLLGIVLIILVLNDTYANSVDKMLLQKLYMRQEP